MSRIDLPPYPTGWFAVAASDELAPGEILSRTYFGQDLVIVRDQAGTVAVLDAYCPHLGAHLGHGGTVGEGCITCPFHGWEFALDGTCVGMPYGSRIPPAATTRSWPVVEQDGVVLVWHDPRGAQPTWSMPSFEDRSWTKPRTMARTIRSHPQDILENTVDCAHFRFVHQTHIVQPVAEANIDGPTFEVVVVSDPDAVSEELRLDDAVELAGTTLCHGPGLAAATLGARQPGVGLPTLQRLYATPIDGERIDLLGLVTVEIRDDDAAAAEEWAELIAPSVIENWDSDIPIWEHKRYLERPALNGTERMIPLYRRWYAQFYASEATPPTPTPTPAPANA